MKKVLALALSLALIATMAISTTVAYLTSEDSDVNVMTLGNVKIEQIELERSNQTNSGDDGLETFEQDMPLYPAVGEIKWAEDASGRVYQKWPSGGSSALFDSNLKNVRDKFVFVENTGKSNAYVRTVFAFEAGDMTVEEINNGLIHWNRNADHWKWSDFSETMKVNIDGADYYIREAIYTGNAGENKNEHVNGVLAPNETTRPSLLQVFLDSKATNEDMTKIDGNGNGTYDILVLSQAVQTAGFANAETALDTAFGDVETVDKETLAAWFAFAKPQPDTSWYDADATEYTLDSAEDMLGFAELVNNENKNFSGKTVKLGADISLAGIDWEPIGQTGSTEFKGVFDGDNHTISNLRVDSEAETGANYSSGLFGWIESHAQDITIKNVKVDGATVVGHHNVAVIAGYLEGNSVVENCHVTNATLSNTSANNDANGDKTGTIAGYAAAEVTVKNCTAKNVTIQSGRDAGQIIGASYTTPVSCSATNVTVSANGTSTGANIRNELVGRELS